MRIVASHHPSLRVTLVALLCLAVACADPAVNTAPAHVAEHELVEAATIGSESDDGPDAFGRIAGIGVVSGGRFVVLDNVYDEVRLFSSDGTFPGRAGRDGSGPGEPRQAFGLGVAPDDIMWVRDNGNGCYVRFAVDGDSLFATNMFALNEGVQGPGIAPTFDRHGRLIHLGLAPGSDGGDGKLTRFTLASDANGPTARFTVVEPPPDSIGQYAVPMSDGSTRYFHQPCAPSFLHAHANGGDWVRAVSSIAAVERHDVTGALMHRVSMTPERVGLSATEQSRADSIIARSREMAGRELHLTRFRRASGVGFLSRD